MGSYLLIAALALAVSAPAAYRFGAPLARFAERAGGIRTVAAMAGGIFLIYLGWGIFKLGAVQMGLWDFGIYDSLLHYAAQGKGLMRDFRGGAFDHFSPAILLLLPLYLLNDAPEQLVWVQALFLAAGGPVLYLLSKKYLKQNAAPLLLTAMYYLSMYYNRLALYDFHIECMFPALFLGAFLARANGHRRSFIAMLLATVLIKEDFIVPLGAAGLFFLFSRGERRTGLILLAGAGLWTLFVLKVYFPAMTPDGYWHYGRYPLFAPTATETLGNISAMAGRVLSLQALVVTLSVLLPFALLPAAHWRMALLLLLPTVGIQLAGAFAHQNLLVSHYGSALIAVAPLAALWGLRRIRATWRRRSVPWQKLGAGAFFFALLLHIGTAELPLVRYYSAASAWNARFHGGLFAIPLRGDWYGYLAAVDVHGVLLHDLAARIPAQLTVEAQNELGSLFVRHAAVHSISTDKPLADILVVDAANYSGYEDGKLLKQRIHQYAQSPQYRTVYAQNQIMIVARKNIAPELIQKINRP